MFAQVQVFLILTSFSFTSLSRTIEAYLQAESSKQQSNHTYILTSYAKNNNRVSPLLYNRLI